MRAEYPKPEDQIIIATKREVEAGKLTPPQLIISHELDQIIDDSQDEPANFSGRA
ncbi:MAG: hypothetical protein ACM3UY_04420 [Methanocella sp.]|jgi:hypothetical protein